MTRLLGLLCLTAALGCGQAVETTAVAPEAPEPVVERVITPLKVTPVAFSEAGDPVVEFATPGMHCEACAANITQTLTERQDVVEVAADAETKVVTVTFAQDGFDAEASMAAAEAVAAIADAGFGEATPIDPEAAVADEVDSAETSG